MLNLRFEVSTKLLADRFGDKYPKRLRFAAVNAANQSALRLQQLQFVNVANRFTIRTSRTAAFFAGTPGKPGGASAKVLLAYAGGGGRSGARIYSEVEVGKGFKRTLLPQFEYGGTKLPHPGRSRVAVPLTGRPARPAFSKPVPEPYQFAGAKGLGLRAYSGGRKQSQEDQRKRRNRKSIGVFGEFGALLPNNIGERALQWKGRHRTFMLLKTAKLPLGGVFQRIGKGRGPGGVILIWKFQPSAPIDKRMQFYNLARSTVPKNFRDNFIREIVASITYVRRTTR